MSDRPPQSTPLYWRRRLVPVAALAGASLVAGIAIGATHHDDRLDVATAYARAWTGGDYTAMYRALTDDARTRVSYERFVTLHRQAAETATVQGIALAGAVRIDGDTATIPLRVRTRIFGAIVAPVVLPLSGDGDAAKVDWKRRDAFPGLRDGEQLTRTTTMPDRGTLLTRDGKVLAKGAARTPDPDVADVAANTVGEMGEIPAERAAELRSLGVPTGTKVGTRGLERALDTQLIGTPGGQLRAGGRVLASTRAKQAAAVRTTIAPSIERAAVTALASAGNSGGGGVVALDPRNGQLLAFAGIAFSGLQPPGSTFKIITLSGALADGVAKAGDSFPVQTAATLEGVQLSNANGESCGGSLTNSFAESCNSVFAPLGAKLGAERLVKAAESFGFNSPPDIAGAATSTIPAASTIGDDLAVGSSAIGQGQVQATALQMASVAATIGLRGRRPNLTLALPTSGSAQRGDGKRRIAIPQAIARTVEKMMLAVVRYGTGKAAAIPSVKVAGKTGTAELKNTHDCTVDDDPLANPEDCQSGNDPTDTDAWFAAYAPAGNANPRVAVGVMLVGAGAGGDSAAPVARQILEAALKR